MADNREARLRSSMEREREGICLAGEGGGQTEETLDGRSRCKERAVYVSDLQLLAEQMTSNKCKTEIGT